MLSPTIDAVADTVGSKAIICKVNVDEAPGIAQQFGVSSIPTIIYFKNGQRVAMSGNSTKDAILARIDEIA